MEVMRLGTFGNCQLYIHHMDEVKPIVFNVMDVEGPAILGCETSRDLGLIQFPCKIMHVYASAPTLEFTKCC
jgi:hypothetical protein